MNKSKTNPAKQEMPGAHHIDGEALGQRVLTRAELLSCAGRWAQMLPANDPRRAVLREDIAEVQREAAAWPGACQHLAQALMLLGAAGPVTRHHVEAACMVADAWVWPQQPGSQRAGEFALEALGLKSLNDASPGKLLVMLADAYSDMACADDVFNAHLAIVAPAEFARLNAWQPPANDEGGAQ